MQNYFNYFTEIEERFQQRRGSLLLLSTIDWALIETWREAGVPLEAVLRGIDAAFDKYDARKTKSRVRRINCLAWCAQEVMQAAVDLQEARVGAAPSTSEQRTRSRLGTRAHRRASRRLCAQRAAYSIAAQIGGRIRSSLTNSLEASVDAATRP